MRTALLIALFTTAVCDLVAQNTFMKTFNGVGTARANLNELSSGNVKIGMTRGMGTALMDPQGNIFRSHIYLTDTFLNMKAVKKRADNEFVFVSGYHKDPCLMNDITAIKTHPVIGTMDSIGNILSARHYALSVPICAGMASNLEITSTNNVVAWGAYVLFALRVDSLGEVMWAKSFDRRGTFQFIKELPGGDLLAGINMDTAAAVVARMDADGNFIWCKSYIRPSGMVHDAVIESDDSFIITGVTDSTNANPFFPLAPSYQPKLFMMKLNGNGDVQWCRGYDSAPHYWYSRSASRIVKAQDGNYVLLATLGYPEYNWFYRPFLMKTDLNGDTLWTRSMGVEGYGYETMDLLAYSDGGFIYNGRVWGDLPDGQANFAFIHKTDPEGHLPCSERHQPVQVTALFPVDSSFVMPSVGGAVSKPAFVLDADSLPITNYEACETITAIHSTGPPEKRPSVRPNPNTGRFTVQFQDPLLAESYYSVFDTMGKLLMQRRLPTGATLEEVDLSRFGRGTYVLKFTSPEGVCHERVVVE